MPHRAPRPRRLGGVALLVVLLAGLVPVLRAPPSAADPRPTYVPPVQAPVHDPFRAPDGPYGPGNRGIEYDTAPGTVVIAAAAGRVTFAGWVAGSRHVTLLHPDGVRTTASYLHEVDVVVGQEVEQGHRLGTTAGRLHFGARRGDAYFDPASLFGQAPVRVRLVPFDQPPGAGAAGERSAISQLLGGGGRLLGSLGAVAGDLAGDLAGGVGAAAEWTGSQALGAAGAAWRLHGGVPFDRVGRLVVTGVVALADAWVAWRRPCTADDEAVAPPAERRIGLLVAGFGSTSTGAAIDDLDVDVLGYEPPDVLRFSYAGGRIPDPDVALAGVPVSPYGRTDSQQDLLESGARLADLLEAVAAAAPGVPIDLLAHSQGGVVSRLALAELEARHGPAWLRRIGLLATVATPHAGADLATAGAALRAGATGTLALTALDAVPGLDTRAPSMVQLAETSEVIRSLARRPVPVPAVSVAARGDAVVPAPRTEVDGAREAVVPLVGLGAHSALPGDARTTREVALALAGAPPRCVALATALADEVVGWAIGSAEDALGDGLALVLADAGGPVGGAATAALAAERARR